MIYDLVSRAFLVAPSNNGIPIPSSVTEMRFTELCMRGPSKHFSSQLNLLGKVHFVVTTIFAVIIKFALFLFNPGLMVMGFVSGIISENCSLALARIKLVWHNSSWASSVGYVGLGFLAGPTVVALTSFLWASEYGAQRYADACAGG